MDSAWVEVCRLTLIRAAGLDVVVRTDLYVELFFPVRVHVPKNIVNDPSSLGHQPSYAGATLWPFAYVSRVCAAAAGRSSAIARRVNSSADLKVRTTVHYWLAPVVLVCPGAVGGAQHSGQPMS